MRTTRTTRARRAGTGSPGTGYGDRPGAVDGGRDGSDVTARLRDVAARHAAAQAGSWARLDRRGALPGALERSRATRAFVVAAHDRDVPWLLRELRRAHADVERLRGEVDVLRGERAVLCGENARLRAEVDAPHATAGTRADRLRTIRGPGGERIAPDGRDDGPDDESGSGGTASDKSDPGRTVATAA